MIMAIVLITGRMALLAGSAAPIYRGGVLGIHTPIILISVLGKHSKDYHVCEIAIKINIELNTFQDQW